MARRTVHDLVAAAKERVENLTVEQVAAERERGEALLIDIRDVRERWERGAIPGARHVPRGVLEFWADPESPYHRDFLQPDARIICYCAGGQRSALAAAVLQDIGYTDVAHLQVGFNGWCDAGGEHEVVQPR